MHLYFCYLHHKLKLSSLVLSLHNFIAKCLMSSGPNYAWTSLTERAYIYALDMSLKYRYIREWLNSMVSGSIIDHCQIDDVDRYYIAADKVSTLCNKEGSLCPVTGVELFIGAVTNFGNVEKCYPKDGPTGQCFQSCFRGKILLYP